MFLPPFSPFHHASLSQTDFPDARVPARVIDGEKVKRVSLTIQQEPRMDRCCFDCDFFEFQGNGIKELTEADWQGGCAEGECRFNPPVLGPEIERDGDTYRCYGEFPKVLSGDWCGQFKPRST